MLHITVITLFPDMFVGPFDQSIIKRALKRNLVSIEYVNVRDFASDAYKSVDDHPYGGGHGMILRADIMERAIIAAKKKQKHLKPHTILLDPQGKTFVQKTAKRLSTLPHIILICGHYEGFDERIRSMVDEELSIGDYIVTGGEIPAMAVVDSVVRLLPGALKRTQATSDESFSESLLEYPQYTRPEKVGTHHVPQVLLSGNHARIATWKKAAAMKRTKERRPDLLK